MATQLEKHLAKHIISARHCEFGRRVMVQAVTEGRTNKLVKLEVDEHDHGVTVMYLSPDEAREVIRALNRVVGDADINWDAVDGAIDQQIPMAITRFGRDQRKLTGSVCNRVCKQFGIKQTDPARRRVFSMAAEAVEMACDGEAWLDGSQPW